MVEKLISEDFRGRVLDFDLEAARLYSVICSRLSAAHINPKHHAFDCQIAAVAMNYGFRVATRNVKDFFECGVELCDPWAA